MNNPYARIVSNGVFGSDTSSTDMQVQAAGGMSLKVKQGRGIFAGKWAFLDADMAMTVPMAHVSYTRIDSVIVRIDTSEDVRAGSVIYRNGEPDENPTPPALVNSVNVKEYRLANISVPPNTATITQANITDTRPSGECGFIHNLLWDSDVSAIYAQWQAQFEEWFTTIRETLATATIISSFTSRYTATGSTTTVPINIQRYNKALDILQVYINGMLIMTPADYTINNNNTITLTLAIESGTVVDFIVYKSVDGSEAESVVRYVDQLLATSPVAENGGVEVSVPATGDVLQSFINAGLGLHTLYSAYGATNAPRLGAFRYFGHLTAAGYGWVIGFMANGSVFANYMDNNTWQGWRTIYEDVPDALFYSSNGVFPNDNVAVTPSKPLSECKNGWVLEFSSYDDTNNTPRDVYAQSVYIFKKSYKNTNWNGEGYSMALVYSYATETDTTNICCKNFSVYNDRIVSGTINATGKQRKMVLRAIYEF